MNSLRLFLLWQADLTTPKRGEQTAMDITLLARQDVSAGRTVTISCENSNEYDGRLGLRIAAIFVILVGSAIGAIFPVFAARHKGIRVPEWSFFIAKYFGSGVIVATAFIHLLAPAHDALTSPCLTGSITDYTWVEGICLMTIFSLFFVELMVMRYARFDSHSHQHEDGHHLEAATRKEDSSSESLGEPDRHVRGKDHLSHQRHHVDNQDTESHVSAEDYAAQMTAIAILEFGVIFHSVFIGLTLAVAGEEFTTLFIVLVFHQTFEGLGLGSRLASTPWPRSKKMTPYVLGCAYALSTPIAIAVGLGIRSIFAPNSTTFLIVNGIFDSISAGILIYTGLVELMAHEFMFSNVMRKAKTRTVMSAFGMMCLGAALMALLGKWA